MWVNRCKESKNDCTKCKVLCKYNLVLPKELSEPEPK